MFTVPYFNIFLISVKVLHFWNELSNVLDVKLSKYILIYLSFSKNKKKKTKHGVFNHHPHPQFKDCIQSNAVNHLKIGGAPGNAFLFLQRRHTGGYVRLGPSPQSVCIDGDRRLSEPVQNRISSIFCWLINTFLIVTWWRLIAAPLLSGAAQVIRISQS